MKQVHAVRVARAEPVRSPPGEAADAVHTDELPVVRDRVADAAGLRLSAQVRWIV